MANYNQLKASISAVIKSNNRNEITGQILQNVLNQMVGVIGENYQLAGFATPLTNPGAPDQNVFYVADQGGAYVNFDNIVLDAGLSFLMWKNSQWTSHTVNIVTAEWVEQNYVSIDFFRSLFRAYDVNDDEILPNNPADPITEEQTVVDSIKAMVGFWTEQYISTLGHGTGGGGGGGGGATVLDDLLDVTIINPLAGQGLIYNGTKWVNQNIPTGTDMATVWTALAGATNQQINISHLTDALATYATQSWVNQNFITIAYFDRLFRAYNGNTLVSHNDTTSTIDNIKAMFGFWTEFYVSALGTGGMQSPIGLASLNDVALTSPISDGQVLQYNLSTGKWTNATLNLGSLTLSGLSDVLLTTPSANQVLLYDGITSKWINSALKTINGQPIYGSGDLSVGGGASGNYLPLTGGTLTGPLTINNAAGLYQQVNSNYRFYIGYDTRGFVQLYSFIPNKAIKILDTGSIEIEGDTTLYGSSIVRGTDKGFNSYSLGFYQFDGSGNIRCYVGMDGSSSMFHLYTPQCQLRMNENSNGNFSLNTSTNSVLTLRSTTNYAFIDFDNASHSGGWIGMSEHDTITIARTGFDFNVASNGRVGIQTYNPQYTLHVVGNIYATGEVTALSDMRKKDECGMIGLSVEQVANAPAVQFTWKGERAKEGMQVGTYAQYWQGVLPEVVMDRGGELSMQYGVAAMVSAIVTARKVVDHERRITELERENKRLRTEIEKLRLN